MRESETVRLARWLLQWPTGKWRSGAIRVSVNSELDTCDGALHGL
jgi:hypothetical protein